MRAVPCAPSKAYTVSSAAAYKLLVLLLLIIGVSHHHPSPAWTCAEARLQARFSSSANTTSSIIESEAPHFALNAHPFNITARLYRPRDADISACALHLEEDNLTGKDSGIVLYKEHGRTSRRDCWKRICESRKDVCVGFVWMSRELAPILSEFAAHTHWEESAFSDAAFPKVALAGGGEAEHWITQHIHTSSSTATAIQVTITSEDDPINAFEEVLRSWPWILFNLMGTLHSLTNVLLVMYKFSTFIPVRCKGIPTAVPFVLIPELFANLIRFLSFFNMGFFESRLYPFWMIRTMGSLPITLGISSTLAIAVIVYDNYHNVTDEEETQRGYYMLSRVLIAIMSVILVLDVIHTLYAGLYGDIISIAVVGAAYTLLQIPVSIVFIRFGGSTAKLLLDQESTVDERERRNRRRFSRRVEFSGIAMIVNIISLVLYVAFGSKSAPAWLYLFGSIHITSNAVASFQIAAVRTPEMLSRLSLPKVISRRRIFPVSWNLRVD